MVFAIEPKKALEGLGMVGIENTFRVTPKGGENLTPGDDFLQVIPLPAPITKASFQSSVLTMSYQNQIKFGLSV